MEHISSQFQVVKKIGINGCLIMFFTHNIGLIAELLYPRQLTSKNIVNPSLVLHVSGEDVINATCDTQYGSQHIM
jgi:hypothetical protein